MDSAEPAKRKMSRRLLIAEIAIALSALVVAWNHTRGTVTPPSYDEPASVYMQRGSAAMQGEDFPAAIQAYTAAIERSLGEDRLDAEAYYQRALAYHYDGQHARSIQDFTTAEELSPRPSQALYVMRAAAYTAIHNLPQAVEDLSSAYLLCSTACEDLIAQRAALYEQMGFYTNAIGDYQLLLQSDKDNLMRQEQLAHAFERAGDAVSAAQAWDALLRLQNRAVTEAGSSRATLDAPTAVNTHRLTVQRPATVSIAVRVVGSEALHPLVIVRDPRFSALAYSYTLDTTRGEGAAVYLDEVQLPTAGTYTVVVGAYGANSQGTYQLSIDIHEAQQ